MHRDREALLTPPPLIGSIESDVLLELLPFESDHRRIGVLVTVESNEEGFGFFITSVGEEPSWGLGCSKRNGSQIRRELREKNPNLALEKKTHG